MFSNGNLTINAIARKIETSKNDNLRPMVTICFDDSYRSDYDIAFPILEEYGLRASFYVIGWENRNTDRFITEEEIKELADHGHEIGCHWVDATHLTDHTDESIVTNLTKNKKWLEEVTGKTVYTHSYPNGYTNEHIDNLVGGIYESTRGTFRGTKTTPLDGQFTHGSYRFNLYGRSPLYNLPATSVDARTGEQTKEVIDAFLDLDEPCYLVLYMHMLYKDDDTERPENRMKESYFREWVAYLSELKEEGKVDVVPYIEGVRRLNGARSAYL